MGLVMRDGINRLAHVKKYSRFYGTICSTIARVGFAAGTGKVAGVDPREMGVSDLVVIWGTNPVQHPGQRDDACDARARKERGAKIAVIDVYNNDTMKQADIKILLRPGTDGAFACGVMHVLFREGYADREYLDRYTDCPGRARGASGDPHAGMGVGDLGRAGRRDRGLRPRWSARPSGPSSVSAMVLPAAAMARRRCTRHCAFPR